VKAREIITESAISILLVIRAVRHSEDQPPARHPRVGTVTGCATPFWKETSCCEVAISARRGKRAARRWPKPSRSWHTRREQ